MMPATEVIIADFNFLSELINNQTRVVVNMTSDGKQTTTKHLLISEFFLFAAQNSIHGTFPFK